MEFILLLIVLGWMVDKFESEESRARHRRWKERVKEDPNILDTLM